MERKLMDELIKWKNSSRRKPLILEGARQVGKTWLLKEFGRRYFNNTAYINCDNNSAVGLLFEDYDTSRIIRGVSVITEEKIDKQDTLIIIDEIQELPGAISSLKYFCEEAPEYHIAVAGSLLGIKLHADESFPVGKVNSLRLYPLDFEEFILALGREQLLDILKTSDFKELSAFENEFTDILRQYYFVGGMPEAVSVYVETKDPGTVRRVQNEILSNYISDISKHADTKLVPKINMIWNSIPAQLAKENKKFVYGALKKGARASEYETAIQWLVDAGMVHKVFRVSKAAIPLKFYEEFSAFKLFLNDAGLLGAMSETPAASILLGTSIFSEYKGAFTEQYVFQQLICSGKSIVNYYTNENSTLEIDFIVQKKDKVFPVEVKAEKNLRSKSLRAFIDRNPELHGIRFSMSGYIDQGWMENVPLYCVKRWDERYPLSCRSVS